MFSELILYQLLPNMYLAFRAFITFPHLDADTNLNFFLGA